MGSDVKFAFLVSCCPEEQSERKFSNKKKRFYSICWSKFFNHLLKNSKHGCKTVLYVSRKLFQELFFQKKNLSLQLHSCRSITSIRIFGFDQSSFLTFQLKFPQRPVKKNFKYPHLHFDENNFFSKKVLCFFWFR